ncbi:MAG TPA: hypothetical protein VGB36_14590, partial [Gammaproteobacteria bacterium]
MPKARQARFVGNGNYDNACFDGPVYDMEREILNPNLVGLLAGKRGSGKPGARRTLLPQGDGYVSRPGAASFQPGVDG